MEHKSFPTFTKEIDTETRTVTGIAAVIGNMDAGQDIIHKGAFKRTIRARSERVKHLWQHDNWQPPIAAIKELREIGEDELPRKLKADYPDAKGALLVVRKYLDTPRANEVYAGLTSDPPAITEMSFAFDPVKYDFETLEVEDGEVLVRNLRELRLWDTSDVVWGMNEATMAVSKSAVPYKDTGMAELKDAWTDPTLQAFSDRPWAQLPPSERQRIAAHFAFEGDNDAYTGLKLAHHQASRNGVGPAVLAGVKGAMNELLTSGLQMAPEDRKAVYTHLVKHYEQFDQEAPPLPTVELAWSLSDALAKAKDAEAHDLIQALQDLTSQLRLDPHPAKDALTLRLSQDQLMRQKARLQRQIHI